jgi:hypothetical protein
MRERIQKNNDWKENGQKFYKISERKQTIEQRISECIQRKTTIEAKSKGKILKPSRDVIYKGTKWDIIYKGSKIRTISDLSLYAIGNQNIMDKHLK